MGLHLKSNGVVVFDSSRKLRVDCDTDVGELSIADGEITTSKIAALAVTTAKIAADAVNGTKIADDAVDSEHIADGAIDLAHMAANSVDSDQYVDGSIDTAHLAAGAATLPKLDLFTGLKVLGADGANSTGGDAQVTLTGTVIGDRVVAIFGAVKVAHAGAFKLPTIPTHFEGTITVTDKIVQKQAAGDLSANTYIFILAPAAA